MSGLIVYQDLDCMLVFIACRLYTSINCISGFNRELGLGDKINVRDYLNLNLLYTLSQLTTRCLQDLIAWDSVYTISPIPFARYCRNEMNATILKICLRSHAQQDVPLGSFRVRHEIWLFPHKGVAAAARSSGERLVRQQSIPHDLERLQSAMPDGVIG
jgi:hypothetical protein